MMINEAHAQATAASGRGDGQYPSGLHDGAEISTAAAQHDKDLHIIPGTYWHLR